MLLLTIWPLEVESFLRPSSSKAGLPNVPWFAAMRGIPVK